MDAPDATTAHSVLPVANATLVVEVGPRLCFSTPWSSNAESILESSGLKHVVSRMERSRRYAFFFAAPLSAERSHELVQLVHDRMTEEVYSAPLQGFPDNVHVPQAPRVVALQAAKDPKAALRAVSDELGLSFDEWDVDYYHKLFVEMKRDPTDVELFDLAQSNSEHSRHWFFGGIMVIDDQPQAKSLFQMVKATLEPVRANSVIAFHDNSSAIRGLAVKVLVADKGVADKGVSGRFHVADATLHGTLTAETHNFPTGVAPFPGAETGTGGRIRDVQCVGRGARVVAGTSAYCVGQLLIPDYPLPWESAALPYPSNLASPLNIEIEASNGASDYGNKFGEPVVAGHTRSFGLVLPSGERREWLKPIMFTSGVGLLDARHEKKAQPEPGMLICKIGGPAYRIGMGGGAASSRVQDAKNAALDFDAVQRGDAEMENKMNRVVRACVELGDANPIVSIHDQGAGGNGNVLKEICDPVGGEIFLRRLVIGDQTMTARELWTAEYQENNACLIRPEHRDAFVALCERERCPMSVVGEVKATGRVVVRDGVDASAPVVVDLSLERVLGKMPPKTFSSSRALRTWLRPFALPEGETVASALDRVLRLLSVGSKRFLTNKVDRCVTGLVAQQQCVGPLHTPLADVAVVAQSHFAVSGVATATGEQPIKGLVSPRAGARMSVGEALTNLVWARVGALAEVKCRGNWMWAAKLPGEGADMYDACRALCDALVEVGVGMDGGKDSLSMAAKVDGATVKAPGQVAVSVYGMVKDVRLTVTPDLKPVPGSLLLFVDLSVAGTLDRGALGGSALAQVYGQIGNDAPDFVSARLVAAFDAVQGLLDDALLLAGHDRSDGGLLTCALEMAFAGDQSLALELHSAQPQHAVGVLFGEDLGLLLQVDAKHEAAVVDRMTKAKVPCSRVGRVLLAGEPVTVRVGGAEVFRGDMRALRDTWEATSFALERRQCDPAHVQQEQQSMRARKPPPYKVVGFMPAATAPAVLGRAVEHKFKVAVLREEGSNGDKEMAAAFFSAGFDVWDVTMDDLRHGRASLDAFRGVAFVGGFSFADVFGSAKGWGAAAKFNAAIWTQLQAFMKRPDTFSLGVCNGCQFMALLGLAPALEGTTEPQQPRFVHNASGRFESRFTALRVEEGSPAIMLSGMHGSVLGCWVAHGEGRAIFPDARVLEAVEQRKLAALRYVDDDGKPTMTYPFNPNGSTNAIAGLCSPDGRHLCVMPHPERSFIKWQLPWSPPEWAAMPVSPWLHIFQNARLWCEQKKA